MGNYHENEQEKTQLEKTRIEAESQAQTEAKWRADQELKRQEL